VSTPAAATDLFQFYTPAEGAYDEFATPERQPRKHLTPFVESINKLGSEEFASRWGKAQRLLQENGFAYSGHATRDDKPRPWTVDALPLLIPPQDWSKISAALLQRATVLDLVLKDLFGSQTLIKQGILPPELVYAHPGFMRTFHGQPLPGDRYLHFYAADLARAADGKWWVLADRTEAPSGIGYALENRVVVSRMLPEAFQQSQVSRMAPFFMTAQKTLRSLAPDHRENPHVVLLSHGPTSPNYFEDAYLARYLGYTLVEGDDLTVRNKHVMLKTLAGLAPVDVILRRQNSDACDPLELTSTSTIGVAGLMRAARAGNVAIANVLGSGLVESAVFMAFMPQLCQALTGEPLLMPGVASWWCGKPDALQYTLSHLDELTIHPAFRNRGYDGRARDAFNSMPPEKLTALIKANPAAYVAQEKVVRSSVPVWSNGMKSAHLALRSYLVSDGDTYRVLQGGLARTSTLLQPLELSIRNGEGSKDTWVMSGGPVEHVSLLESPGQEIILRRTGAELPSRAADNIYWLGRQVERAEASARLLRSAISRMSGETRSTSEIELPVLLRCLADQGQIEPAYAIRPLSGQLKSIENMLPELVFDKTNSASLRSVIDEFYRLGSIVRDRFSHDAWRIIRRINKGFRPARRGPMDLADISSMTDELVIGLASFNGMALESMTRTQSFRFLELGRRVERSWQIIGLVKNCLIPLPDPPRPVFETVLEVADSTMTYRSRYLANLQLPAVLDLLLTDETNPRSLAYQFKQLSEHVEQLPRLQSQPGYTAEQRFSMSLLHSVRQLDVLLIAEAHSLGETDPLEQLIEEWESLLPALTEAISHRYLVHAVAAHQLSSLLPQQSISAKSPK